MTDNQSDDEMWASVGIDPELMREAIERWRNGPIHRAAMLKYFAGTQSGDTPIETDAPPLRSGEVDGGE